MYPEKWRDWEITYLRFEVRTHVKELEFPIHKSAAERIRYLHATVLKGRSTTAIQQRFYKELRRFD